MYRIAGYMMISGILGGRLYGIEEPSSSPRVFYEPTQKVYFVPAQVDLDLSFREVGAEPIQLSKGKGVAFSEGKHTVRIPSDPPRELRIVSDGTPPKTEYTMSKAPRYQQGNKVYFGQNFSITFDVKESSSGLRHFWMSENNGPWRSVATGLRHFPNSGAYHLRFFAEDQVGNREFAQTLDFEVDVTPPTCTAITELAGEGGKVFSQRTRVSLTAQDEASGIASIKYQIDNSPPQGYLREFTVGTLTTGSHKIHYFTEDHVKNKSTIHDLEFLYNETPPEIQVEVKSPNFQMDHLTYVRASTQIQVKAQDVLHKSVKVSLDTQGKNPVTSTTNPVVVTYKGVQGAQELRVKAEDSAGNLSEITKKFIVDETPPEVSLQLTGAQIWKDGVAQIPVGSGVVVLGADHESGIKSLELCEGEVCRPYKDVVIFKTPGERKLFAKATDRLGNLRETKPILVRTQLITQKDLPSETDTPKSEPQLWVKDQSYGAIGPKKREFVLVISDKPDGSGVNFTLDNKDLKAFLTQDILPFSISLGKTTSTGKIPLEDLAPRSRIALSGARTFRDQGKTFYGPGLRATISSIDPPGRLTLASGVKHIMIAKDGEPFNPAESPSWEFKEEVAHSLSFYGVDRVGNTEKAQKISFTVDLTPPITTLDFVKNSLGSVVSKNLQVSITANDNLSGVAGSIFWFDKEPKQPLTKESFERALQSLKGGKHTVSFGSWDHVANQEPTQIKEFNLDTEPPQVAWNLSGKFSKVKDRVFYGPKTTVRLSARDNEGVDQIHWRWTGEKAWKPLDGEIPLPEDREQVTLEARAIDLVGNESQVFGFTWMFDKDPPKTDLITEGPAQRFLDNIYLRPNSRLVLKSSDLHQGQGHIKIRKESGSFEDYKGPLSAKVFSDTMFSYYALDSLDNQEELHEVHVVVDLEPPAVDLVFSEQPKFLVNQSTKQPLSTRVGSLVYLNAHDDHSGVKSLEYKINDGPFQIYRGPILMTKPGPVKFELKAKDWVDQLTSAQYQWTVN